MVLAQFGSCALGAGGHYNAQKLQGSTYSNHHGITQNHLHFTDTNMSYQEGINSFIWIHADVNEPGDTVASVTCAQCEAALIYEDNRAPNGDLPVLEFYANQALMPYPGLLV